VKLIAKFLETQDYGPLADYLSDFSKKAFTADQISQAVKSQSDTPVSNWADMANHVLKILGFRLDHGWRNNTFRTTVL